MKPMGLKHKVCINVIGSDGTKKPVIRSGTRKIRSKLLNLLLGEKVSMLFIAPGESVETVEIREIKEGGTKHEQNKAVT